MIVIGIFEFRERSCAGWFVETVEESLVALCGLMRWLVLLVEFRGGLEGGFLAAEGDVVRVNGQLGRAAVRAGGSNAQMACSGHRSDQTTLASAALSMLWRGASRSPSWIFWTD